ncbi:CLUMA_CG009532, isoform A [Clunio marinus]|uniref:CLUMA_CG009532, isoform A n=1 Tax=Clunio marinus TaxID=568069 RepID=A0A1J1ICD4_9DIPT|nr:CLUMA_CG009532, isoform A [Clunio marinus]
MLSKGFNFFFLILFVCSANSQQPHHQQRHQARTIQQLARTKKIFAMCPPNFTKIGNECYYLSPNKASWLDSHFECKDKNSKLAEPLKSSDRLLRKYFMTRGRTRGEIWIGGMYNWQRFKWQWGYNGKDMTYQSFSQMKPGEDLKYNCAVLNPDLKYRWSAKLCFEKHFYLCQHRMPFVSERSRQRIYAKWNETFPGQFANEIQVYVTTNGSIGNRREYYRATSKRPDIHQISSSGDQYAQASNQVPSTARFNGVISNEINPPEVLSNRGSTINQSKLVRNKKQPNNRRKQLKTLKLTGNVDLGNDIFKHNKQYRRRNNSRRPPTTTAMMTTSTTTTQHPNTISENFQPSHHRHNHYENRQHHPKPSQNESPQYPVAYPPETTSTRIPFIQSTTPQARIVENTTLSQMATKLLEKKKRLENIRNKLSKLSDQERLEFLRMKAERKAKKSVKRNDTIP